VGRVLVSRTGDVGWTVSLWERCLNLTYEKPQKVLIGEDNSTVAMEVGIR